MKKLKCHYSSFFFRFYFLLLILLAFSTFSYGKKLSDYNIAIYNIYINKINYGDQVVYIKKKIFIF
ncbi:hypothetical protein GWK41_03250 [Persephonella atlantica]|uniref:Uncharacterized protein n=1 Tax=Persephonella atlantica TaxID=2699429 RepID=A0ABS1GGM6_9AQUI|nr:hypothetical protein [Persephonella atlantica]MBK3332084.1 hypothetical protein [Persephonella atlantica]